MAKAKQTRRMVAMALAAAVTMSSVPVVAFAEEVPASETSAPASDTTTSTEKTETPTSDGGTQITETTTTTTGTANAETGETGDKGSIEITSEVTIKDADGNIVESFTVTEGKSTETTETPDDGKESGQPPVTVPLTPGETTGEVITNTEIDGDVPTDEDDLEFDYTQTDTIDRTVTVNTSEVEITVNGDDNNEAEMEGIGPDFDAENKKTGDLYADNGHFGFSDGAGYDAKNPAKNITDGTWENIVNELMKLRQDAINADDKDAVAKYDKCVADYVAGGLGSIKDANNKKVTDTVNPETGEINDVIDTGQNIAENFEKMMQDETMLGIIKKVLGDDFAANAPDADYRFVGNGDYSGAYASHLRVIYAKDEQTGLPLVDENGNYVIESIQKASTGEPLTVSKVPVSAVDLSKTTLSQIPVDMIDETYLAELGDISGKETLDKVPTSAIKAEYFADENVVLYGVSYLALTEKYKEEMGGDLSALYDQKTGTRPQQFMLMDKDGNYVYGYCIDIETGAVTNNWYKVANLEDNDYYASQEAEDHVRSIVMNGYWGAVEYEKNEDGSYKVDEEGNKIPAPVTGSLEKIKQDLKNTLFKDGKEEVTVKVPYRETYDTYTKDGYDPFINSEPVVKEITITKDMIDQLTPGEALNATQMAIWSYANGAMGVQDGKDGVIVGGAMYSGCVLGDSLTGKNDPAGMARMKVLYDWLMALETEEESTTVINEKTFGETSLTIGDKIASSDDGKGDTYEASLNFKAEFEVGKDDKLYVNLTYKDLNGEEQTVRKQLGVKGAEATDTMIVPNEDNSYTLTDLALTENKDFTFDLRLEGVQQLKQGAYIYVAENGVGTSQTMVGIGEGTNTVDISAKVTVNFDVDEDDVVRKVRKWRDDGRIKFENDKDDPNPPKEDPTPDPKDPGMIIPDEDVPLAGVDPEEELADIADEEVPMADAPEEPMVLGAEEEAPLIAATGDSNHMAAGFGGMFAALAGMFFLRKKKED